MTFDTFYIPPVHLARNHGANIREESEEVRRHTTDQTLELVRSECEARHCLLPEPVRGRRVALPNQERESHMTEYFDHQTVSITHFSELFVFDISVGVFASIDMFLVITLLV